ncbi:MAG: flippase-like domain-containing protein [Alphaproteobacteria bacterium]|nr:flippase-like domain-containing protein [Alphaproteobacteria bacterium]
MSGGGPGEGSNNAAVGFGLIAFATVAFGGVSWMAWQGRLGLVEVGMLLVAAAAYFVGRRSLSATQRKRMDGVAKVLFTLVGIMALLRHPIEVEGDTRLPIYQAIAEYIDQVDRTTFITFALVAMAVKFSGVITSAYAWSLLLRGQGLRFPFWSQVFTAFLIGRFIGTFLPSTIGLDAYTLYEAGRYSNQWPRAITAKVLEKFIGVTGLFLGMVVTLPFGYQVIVDVTTKVGKPEAAPLLAGAIAAFAGGVSLVVIVGLVWPVVIVGIMNLLTRIVGDKNPVTARINRILGQFTEAVGAYHGKVGLLLLALFNKFITHFTTAAVYFFTALAIGVAGAKFWPITFGSTIQILATVLSPTIAGEGAREAFQALLLSEQLGGVAQAVLSGALGFIAAEAATMWGGLFLWTRTPGWRPAFATVDGQQVDYAWIDDSDDGGFDAEKIAAARKEHMGS